MLYKHLFIKLYGELYANGEPVNQHADADDPSSQLAKRFKIRTSAKQAAERHHAKELVRKSVAARTRSLQTVAVGEIVSAQSDPIPA